MSTFFSGVPQIKFEGSKSKSRFAFKFYNPDEIVGGKAMREQLKFAMSWWHTLCGEGGDPFGPGTIDRSYGQPGAMARCRAKADAAFELMQKLGIGWYCFHDVDVADPGDNLSELKANLLEMTDYLKAKMDSTGVKLLWGTANVFSHPRYMHGAGTNPDPAVFACAAAQIKNALDATVALGGTGYVFWGGREGYETLLNTDMGLELDHLALLLRLSVAYGRKIGFTGDFYIEPKPKEPTKHQYDFDSATVLGFLNKYGLAGDIKLNIEANHATLAGHTFQHELCLARVNGAFGSIDANRGDPQLGWDTDQFPADVYDATLCMLEVLKAGGFTNGGLNFDAKLRRGSFTPEDIALAYISGMDAFALGLKKAQALLDDGRVGEFVAQRYSGWKGALGQNILSGKADLETLEAHALSNAEPLRQSGRQEYLESVLNEVMFG